MAADDDKAKCSEYGVEDEAADKCPHPTDLCCFSVCGKKVHHLLRSDGLKPKIFPNHRDSKERAGECDGGE